MKPLLSIVVPIYNKEKYISEALDSLINQTLREIEIVCVDDGSTDRSGRIADEYAKKDSRIIVLHQTNQGLVNTRRAGLFRSNAEYISFIDADDWVSPHMFKRLYSEMIIRELDFISSGTILDKNGKLWLDSAEEKIYDDERNRKELFSTAIWDYQKNNHGIIPNVCAKIFKKKILVNTCKNIDSFLHYHEGDSFVYSYIIHCKSLGILHEAYYHIRDVENSDSKLIDDYFFARQNCFYLFLKNEFKETLYYNILAPQLDYYFARTIIHGINSRGGLGINAQLNAKFLFAGNEKKKIVIYGAGNFGKKLVNIIHQSEKHELVAIIDKNLQGKNLNGYPIHKVENILEMEFDILIIAIEDEIINRNVHDLLISIGISKEKIKMGGVMREL